MLYIQAFVFVILMGKLMRKVFFGNLRPAEIEVKKYLSCILSNLVSYVYLRD